MTNAPSTLYIVVPCYNESEVFPITSSVLTELLKGMIQEKKISAKSRILFVEDKKAEPFVLANALLLVL